MRTIAWKHWAVAAVAVSAYGGLYGCSKLTYERYQTIHQGAPRTAVEATLGKPTTAFDQRWQYHDPDRQITADIYFDDQGVISKTWISPEHGWEGESPHVTQPGDVEQTRTRKIE